MSADNPSLGGMLRRKDVQYALVFLALYVVWVMWPVYGIMPFFVFAAFIVSRYLKTRKALRQLTRKAKDQFPNKLPEEKWNLLLDYGFPIYAPKDAYALGQVFRVVELGGYVCLVGLVIQQRWADIMACFSGCMFALHLQRMLQPERYFEKQAKKKPEEFGPKAQAIRDLQAWVLSDDAP